MVRRVFQRGVVASGVQPHAGGVRERFGWRAKVTVAETQGRERRGHCGGLSACCTIVGGWKRIEEGVVLWRAGGGLVGAGGSC